MTLSQTIVAYLEKVPMQFTAWHLSKLLKEDYRKISSCLSDLYERGKIKRSDVKLFNSRTGTYSWKYWVGRNR